MLTRCVDAGLLPEEVETAVNAEAEDEVEEAASVAPETFSDLDDDELDACLCTENEAETKKAIWNQTHRRVSLSISAQALPEGNSACTVMMTFMFVPCAVPWLLCTSVMSLCPRVCERPVTS